MDFEIPKELTVEVLLLKKRPTALQTVPVRSKT